MNDPHCRIYTIQLHPMGTAKCLSPDGYFIEPMINRVGDSVVFWGRERGEAGFNIWCHDGTLSKLTHERAVTGHPFWSADGRRIVYFTTLGISDETDWRMARQFELNRAPRNIWAMDHDGANRTQLTEGAFVDERPCISPDGRTVVFVSNRSGHMNLWSVDVASGRLCQITRHDGLDYRPVFSPTGDRLAFFSSNNPRQAHDLCIMEWPSGEIHFPVTPGLFEWIHGPHWLADGKSLLFHARANGFVGIWRCRLSDQTVEALMVPGFKEYAHASVDEAQAVLAFDSHDE